MPNPELSTISVRQITQFPTVSAANAADALLLQSGGLGGPYQTIASANLVATALNAVTDDMGIGGNIILAGYLQAGGDLIVAGQVQIGSGTTIDGGLDVAGYANFQSAMAVDGALAVGSNVNIAGQLTIDLGIDVAGYGNFQNDMAIDGALAVGSNLDVAGSLTVNGAISASGPFYMSGDGSFTGNLLLGGGAQFGGGAKFGGGIYSAGSITAEGGVGLLECLSVGKDATIGGSATINGNVTAPGCVALGPTGITGDLGVFGNLCLAGNFTAEGITTLRASEMCVTGDVGICGNLDVAGLLNAGSGYFKAGIATADGAQIAGRLSVACGASFYGPVDIQSDLTVNGRVGICGFLHLNGQAVATEPWVTGYVCHVGADLLDAISDAVVGLEQKIAESTVGVATFNQRTGHVELRADDIADANGVLRPPQHQTNWYAWHNGAWATFELGGGGGGEGGIPEPSSNGLFGRRRNGGYGWEAVPPRPPSHPTEFYAWRNDNWVPFQPGGGDTGIADLPSGTTTPHARIYGAWQATVPQPPSTADTYFALRNGAWTSFDPGAGGGGGITQQDLDNALANYLPLSGGTMNGAIVLPSDASANQAVRYSQMAAALGGLVTTTAMTTAIGAATTDMATQTWTAGQIGSATAGMATQSWVTEAVGSAIATATTDMATQTWTSGQIASATSGLASQSYVGSAITTATAGMATQSWVNGQIASSTTGMATQSWVGQQLAALPTPANTLQLSLVIPGKPADNQVYSVPIAVPMQLTVTDGVFDGATAYIATPPSAALNFMFRKSPSTILGYLAVYTNGTYSYHSNVAASFASGDVLQIIAPTPQDATLADIGISLLATRT